MSVAWSCGSVLFVTTPRIHCLWFKWSALWDFRMYLLIPVLLLHFLSQTPNCVYFSDKRVNLRNVRRFSQNHTASERCRQRSNCTNPMLWAHPSVCLRILHTHTYKRTRNAGPSLQKCRDCCSLIMNWNFTHESTNTGTINIQDVFLFQEYHIFQKGQLIKSSFCISNDKFILKSEYHLFWDTFKHI